MQICKTPTQGRSRIYNSSLKNTLLPILFITLNIIMVGPRASYQNLEVCQKSLHLTANFITEICNIADGFYVFSGPQQFTQNKSTTEKCIKIYFACKLRLSIGSNTVHKQERFLQVVWFLSFPLHSLNICSKGLRDPLEQILGVQEALQGRGDP